MFVFRTCSSGSRTVFVNFRKKKTHPSTSGGFAHEPCPLKCCSAPTLLRAHHLQQYANCTHHGQSRAEFPESLWYTLCRERRRCASASTPHTTQRGDSFYFLNTHNIFASMVERHPGILCSTARGAPYLHITERARVRFGGREAAWRRSAFVSLWLEMQLLWFASGRQAKRGERGEVHVCILYFAGHTSRHRHTAVVPESIDDCRCRVQFVDTHLVCAPRIKPCCGDQTPHQPRCPCRPKPATELIKHQRAKSIFLDVVYVKADDVQLPRKKKNRHHEGCTTRIGTTQHAGALAITRRHGVCVCVPQAFRVKQVHERKAHPNRCTSKKEEGGAGI